MRPTDWLREQCAEDWAAATDNPFVRELTDGTLPRAKLAWYLVQDYTFIEGFVRLLGATVAAAPSLADALPTARFLGAIAGDENTYFQRCFDELAVPESDRTAPMLSPTAEGFQGIMAGAARSGRYAEMLAVLVGAEWSYLAWASPYADRAASLPFYFGEWISLHTGEYFESVVEHLRGQLDRCWEAAGEAERAETAATFKRMIALERQFFEHAYAVPG
jgi:thiaminase (transcriptional activator TenA)